MLFISESLGPCMGTGAQSSFHPSTSPKCLAFNIPNEPTTNSTHILREPKEDLSSINQHVLLSPKYPMLCNKYEKIKMPEGHDRYIISGMVGVKAGAQAYYLAEGYMPLE